MFVEFIELTLRSTIGPPGLRIHGFASEGNPFLQATGGGIA